MALEKSIIHETGVTTNYHKIVDFNKNEFIVYSYLNQAARLSGNIPVSKTCIAFEILYNSEIYLKQVGVSPLVAAYTQLKTVNPNFIGALDV